jgi:hypothetical protein
MIFRLIDSRIIASFPPEVLLRQHIGERVAAISAIGSATGRPVAYCGNR